MKNQVLKMKKILFKTLAIALFIGGLSINAIVDNSKSENQDLTLKELISTSKAEAEYSGRRAMVCGQSSGFCVYCNGSMYLGWYMMTSC
jgi:hypothetical protein